MGQGPTTFAPSCARPEPCEEGRKGELNYVVRVSGGKKEVDNDVATHVETVLTRRKDALVGCISHKSYAVLQKHFQCVQLVLISWTTEKQGNNTPNSGW